MRTEEGRNAVFSRLSFPHAVTFSPLSEGEEKEEEAIIQILFSLEGAPKMSGLVRSIQGMVGWSARLKKREASCQRKVKEYSENYQYDTLSISVMFLGTKHYETPYFWKI